MIVTFNAYTHFIGLLPEELARFASEQHHTTGRSLKLFPPLAHRVQPKQLLKYS